MRIAYLVSRYPAQSHTFIKREIDRLSDAGVEIVRFSVNRPTAADILGEHAAAEAQITRWLVPPPVGALLSAFAVALWRQPGALRRELADALAKASGRQKLKWLAYFGEGVLLADMLRRSGAQHLHCHFGNAGSNTAMIAARLAKLPYSISYHGIDLDEPEVFRHGEKVRESAFSVCISDYGREVLLHSAPEASDKVHVVRCGFPALPEEQVPPLPGRNHIVCVARLAAEKGHRVLVEALAQLKARGLAFHCTFVGSGPLEEEVAGRIAALDLSERVTMKGALPPQEVAAQIAAADVSVLASFGEGIPIVLMEAFAQQRPVVATRVGGIAELVEDGVSGRLVEAGDATALADALASILADPERAHEMGVAGWLTLKAKYNPIACAEQLLQLFASIV